MKAWTVGATALAALLTAGMAAGTLAGTGTLPQSWQTVRTPSAGPVRVIGTPANGCIAGAQSLPPEGEGYQAIRLSRSRHYGHPTTVDYIRSLAARAKARNLGTLQIGDIGQARGGPMPWGHASHQNGLDVDVWFELDVPPLPREAREGLELASMVDGATKRVDPTRWTEAQAELVRLAARDPRVNRIFVSPAIKLALCERHDLDREWLRLVRPWFGHEAHFHVRLNCPAGQPECRDQEPPPAGDGCGSELMSWFEPPPPAAATPKPPRRPEPPAACAAVLEAP
ncbi:penicillin-insensitive murein endopeptidase [Arenibaculum pallidiluteum]|uniref:penicillin-insensitive murein endopeptidase n=1 Tax=Arenibaculum pallidiluteum TaxID=2812559 RepID=UPI001A96C643|nr:penicillin-insensitive murein endopeptidase [Arenibaculum pallidiluteum]